MARHGYAGRSGGKERGASDIAVGTGGVFWRCESGHVDGRATEVCETRREHGGAAGGVRGVWERHVWKYERNTHERCILPPAGKFGRIFCFESGDNVFTLVGLEPCKRYIERVDEYRGFRGRTRARGDFDDFWVGAAYIRALARVHDAVRRNNIMTQSARSEHADCSNTDDCAVGGDHELDDTEHDARDKQRAVCFVGCVCGKHSINRNVGASAHMVVKAGKPSAGADSEFFVEISETPVVAAAGFAVRQCGAREREQKRAVNLANREFEMARGDNRGATNDPRQHVCGVAGCVVWYGAVDDCRKLFWPMNGKVIGFEDGEHVLSKNETTWNLHHAIVGHARYCEHVARLWLAYIKRDCLRRVVDCFGNEMAEANLVEYSFERRAVYRQGRGEHAPNAKMRGAGCARVL